MTTGRGKVITRVWRGIGPTGRKIKKVSFGYSVAIAGKQERVVKAEWDRDAARAALVARLEEVGQGQTEPTTTTFRQLAAEYLEFKTASGKRSMREDRRIMNKRLVPAFGDLLIKQITEPVVTKYHHARIAEVSAFTVSNELSCGTRSGSHGGGATSPRCRTSPCRRSPKVGSGISTWTRSSAC